MQYFWFLSFLIFEQGSILSQPTKKQVEDLTCPPSQPYKCIYYGICYGANQFCSQHSSSIETCFPLALNTSNAKSLLSWCRRFGQYNATLMRDESCILACQSNFTSRELAETIFDILPVRHFPNSSVFTSCENSDFSAEQRLQKENQDNQPVLNSATTICNFPDISKNLDENLEHLSSTIQDLRNLSTIVQDVRNLSTAVQDLKNVTQDLRNLIESVQYLKKLINTVQDLKNVTEILQDAITQVQNVVSQSKATQAKSDYDIREGLGNVTNILADLTRHIKSLLFTAEPSQRTTSNDMITVLTEVKRLQKTVQDELIGTTSNYVYAILGLVILITATLVVSVIVNIIYIMKCYNKPMTEKKETATEDEDIPLTDVGDKTPAPDIDDRNIRGRVGHIH